MNFFRFVEHLTIFRPLRTIACRFVVGLAHVYD